MMSLTHNSVVQGFPLSEDSVEGNFAKLRSHCGLGQLSDGILHIFYPIAGLEIISVYGLPKLEKC